MNKSENEKDKNKFHDFNNKIFEKYGERRKMLDIDATFWNYIDNKVVLIEGAYCNEYIKDISLLDSYLNHKNENIREHNRNKYLFILKMAKQLKADFFLIGFNENLDIVSVTKAELMNDSLIKPISK